MTAGKEESSPDKALDLEGLAPWLVQRGMRGLPLDEQLAGYCQRIYDAGFPMKRVQLGMGTLHPQYGAHTFLWRPNASTIEHIPRERTVLSRQVYLRSPVHYMRSRGLLTLRRRLDRKEPDDFLLFEELRSEGLVDYAAHLVLYDPGRAEEVVEESRARDLPPVLGQALDGIFFSCATDRPEGFDAAQLGQVVETLPYLALAVKSRLTYDVASTVIETYLGKDAGHRVLTGAIERGAAEAIRAVTWFSDLRGFTRLTDSLPGDALLEVLDDYLEVMARPVQANNGQILKFMGDGLLATFDLTGRDEAAVCGDALTAAAELQRVFPAFNEERKAAGKPVMDFGLALHLGEVLYGNIGASDRLDFTVVGPAVNEASRIQALCKSLKRNVLISDTFRRSAGGQAGLDSLGVHSLRDVRAPQELFTLGA
ncbi:MAG: adenylate/guanylate cyclase domain-containing protein [Kiloniellaceae bacterium]